MNCPPDAKSPARREAAGLGETPSPGRIDGGDIPPKTAPVRADILREPIAVREARRQLNLEFLHECAGGMRDHAGFVKTFAEIGDVAGICYSLRRLLAHVDAAQLVFTELRDALASSAEASP